MPESQYFRSFRYAVTIAATSLLLSGCPTGDEEDAAAADAAIESPIETAIDSDFEVSGSVGDGPVVGAAMRVIQNEGVLLSEFQSDASAGYNIVVKTQGKFYPLIVDAHGGTDLVTNRAPDFVLIGAALEPSAKSVVNLNPFSTLAMEIARDLPGGDTKANIYAAQEIVAGSMNFGLFSLTASGPMTAPIDGGNVAEIVKSSEALGEVVRRTRDWLVSAGFTWDGDAVIRALGSDLIDGVIDGFGGPRADPRAAAIANIVIAQVLLESMSNELYVNGVDATASLESAIQMMNLGTASPVLGELTATGAMIDQINVGLAAADAVSDDPNVTNLAQAGVGLQPGLQPELARSLLPADYRLTLDNAIASILFDWNAIGEVNEVVRNDGDIPGNNLAPQITGTPGSLVETGSMYQFQPTASDPDGDALTFSVSNRPLWLTLNPATGSLSGMPEDGDIGVYSDIIVSVTDGKTSTSLQAFTISVVVDASVFGSATLSWQPPTEYEDGTPLNNDLAGYNIYWGTTPGNYPNSVTINNPGLTTYVVENLAVGTYEFVATAFNASGIESQHSNSASKTVQ